MQSEDEGKANGELGDALDELFEVHLPIAVRVEDVDHPLQSNILLQMLIDIVKYQILLPKLKCPLSLFVH